MYPASIYSMTPRGHLIHYITVWATDFRHAEAVCDECQQTDKEGRDFLVAVLDPNVRRLVHTYSTKDHSKK